MAQAAFAISHFRLHPAPNLKRKRFDNIEVPEITERGVAVEDFICYQRNYEQEIMKLKQKIQSQERELSKVKNEVLSLRKDLLEERKPFQKTSKKFSELHRSSQYNKILDVKKWLCKQFEKLPKDWKAEQVQIDRCSLD